MKFNLIFLLLIGVNVFRCEVIGRPLGLNHGIRVEVSMIEGANTISIDRSRGDGELVKKVERGSRTILIYITNNTEQIFRIPTRGFNVERTTMGGNDFIALVWSETLNAKRKIVIPVSDLGIAEIGQNETARLFVEYSDKWPDDSPIYISFSISEWVMKKYALDYCAFQVALDRKGESQGEPHEPTIAR